MFTFFRFLRNNKEQCSWNRNIRERAWWGTLLFPESSSGFHLTPKKPNSCHENGNGEKSEKGQGLDRFFRCSQLVLLTDGMGRIFNRKESVVLLEQLEKDGMSK